MNVFSRVCPVPRLADYRGKLILLHLWQARQRANDVIALKEVHATFGSDPRFVLISLDFGQSAVWAEESVKEYGLRWTQGFAGNVSYDVIGPYVHRLARLFLRAPDPSERTTPATFLIGPDGRVLAHDMDGGDLEAVRKALEDPKLFPPAAKAADRPGSR